MTKDNTIKSNTNTYNTIIHSYAKNNQPKLAYKVLNELIQIYINTNDNDLKPNIKIYNTIVHCTCIW